MMAKAVVMVVVALAIVLPGLDCRGMEGIDPVVPQFIVGTLAGYGLGLAGAYGLAALFTVDCQGWECLGRAIIGAAVGYLGGATLGASLGVWATGSLLGVEGNIGLCFLGGFAGAGTFVGLGFVLQLPEVLYLVPPAAAAGATAGYNAGRRRAPAR